MRMKRMKAIEVTATLNQNTELLLDQPLEVKYTDRVQVTVLISDSEAEEADEPKAQVLEEICQELYEAMTGQTISLPQMWDEIDAE